MTVGRSVQTRRATEPIERADPAAAAVSLVSINDVGMHFGSADGGTTAIENIAATVGAGRFISIIGPSGCGKSTLLDMVCGLQAPTSGTISIDGKTVRGPRGDTAMVFQEDSTLHWRTVLDNVAFGLEVQGVGKRERRERAREMLALVGLEGFEKHHPRQLSGGMKQRVAIARALVCEPRILLMDEPFGALDQQTRWLVGAELTRVWQASPTSVLFVTHDIQEAVLLSDEVWVLSRRPSRLKKIVTIDLERPRDANLLQNRHFQLYTAELWALLSDEFSDDESRAS